MISLLIVTALLMLPGLAFIYAVGGRKSVPNTWLLLPLATVWSLALLTVLFAAALALHTTFDVVLAAVMAVTIIFVCIAMFRGELTLRLRGHSSGNWKNGNTLLVLGSVVAGAVASWAKLASLSNETLLAVGTALKIAELDELHSASLGLLVNGSVDPKHVVPVFQSVIAVIASVVDPLRATQLLPVVLVPLAILAAAGLARTVSDHSYAAGVGASAWLAIEVFGAGSALSIIDSAAGGAMYMNEAVIPLIVGLCVAVIRRPSAFVIVSAAAATAVVGVVELSSLVYLAVPLAALSLGWLISAVARREAAFGFPVAMAVVASVALVVSYMQAPFLRLQSGYLVAPDTAEIDKLSAIQSLIGSRWLLAIVLIILVVASAARWRLPLAWIGAGSAAFAIGLSVFEVPFSPLPAAMGFTNAQSMLPAIPLFLAAVTLLEVGSMAQRRRRASMIPVAALIFAALVVNAGKIDTAVADRSSVTRDALAHLSEADIEAVRQLEPLSFVSANVDDGFSVQVAALQAVYVDAALPELVADTDRNNLALRLDVNGVNIVTDGNNLAHRLNVSGVNMGESVVFDKETLLEGSQLSAIIVSDPKLKEVSQILRSAELAQEFDEAYASDSLLLFTREIAEQEQ